MDGNEADALMNYNKQFQSGLLSPQELADNRAEITAKNAVILSEITKDDVSEDGLEFFGGMFEGVFEDKEGEKQVRAWASLIPQ